MPEITKKTVLFSREQLTLLDSLRPALEDEQNTSMAFSDVVRTLLAEAIEGRGQQWPDNIPGNGGKRAGAGRPPTTGNKKAPGT